MKELYGWILLVRSSESNEFEMSWMAQKPEVPLTNEERRRILQIKCIYWALQRQIDTIAQGGQKDVLRNRHWRCLVEVNETTQEAGITFFGGHTPNHLKG